VQQIPFPQLAKNSLASQLKGQEVADARCGVFCLLSSHLDASAYLTTPFGSSGLLAASSLNPNLPSDPETNAKATGAVDTKRMCVIN